MPEWRTRGASIPFLGPSPGMLTPVQVKMSSSAMELAGTIYREGQTPSWERPPDKVIQAGDRIHLSVAVPASSTQPGHGIRLLATTPALRIPLEITTRSSA